MKRLLTGLHPFASAGATVYAEGRRKDMISRDGEKISCGALFFELPQVKEVSLSRLCPTQCSAEFRA